MGDQNLLLRAPPCLRRHVKPLLVLAALEKEKEKSITGKNKKEKGIKKKGQFVVHQSRLGPPGGLWPVLSMGQWWL
jgi:hypothetical protein